VIASLKNSIEYRYEEMFRTYYSSLCYFAQKYVADMDACKEIVHNVFVLIWEKRSEFDFEKPAKSYLFTSVYNRCMNYLRDRKKFIDHEVSEITPEHSGVINQDHLESAELESQIWKVIRSLPEKCREIFMLNRFEEKKYAEIAQRLNISVKTVEAQMSKALKILREHLKDYIHFLIFFILKDFWR
jgi:RNA polymerase sigma-70 factor (ECF subfamily)